MFSGLSRSCLLFLLIFHFVLSISSVIRHTSLQDLTVSSKPPLDILKNTITLALNRWSCRAVQLTPTKQCHCFPLDNNRVGWWGLVVGRADSYKGNFGKVPLPNETNEQTSCWNNCILQGWTNTQGTPKLVGNNPPSNPSNFWPVSASWA